MDTIRAVWANLPEQVLLSVLLLLVVLAVWILILHLRHHQQTRTFNHHLLELARSQQALITESRKEVTDAVHQAQGKSQESMHTLISVLQRQILKDSAQMKTGLIDRFQQLQVATTGELNAQRESFARRQAEALRVQQESIISGMDRVSNQLRESLLASTKELTARVDKLTGNTDERLKEISAQVDKRLHQGFEKTTETFSRVLQHLTRIDEAQKKISELSSNVVSLQEVLTDKRSRGAFGEVQLSALVRNVLPENSFSLQQSLSNGKRVDCMLYLPEPTGNVAVDAKFPLESYKKLSDPDLVDSERATAARQFREDIKKHINDIAGKYIIPGETADGAVMFLPAEAIFAEIHAHFPELVDEAQRQRVWLVSPTTMMAILTTARAVIKDDATRKQVHIIQDHLRSLSADFDRFQTRMDKLSTHIRQAHEDVQRVHTSARKISNRFEKIEQVELDDVPELEKPEKPAGIPTQD